MDRSIKIYSNKQVSVYLDPAFILLVVIVSIFGAGIPLMPETPGMRAGILISFFFLHTFINCFSVTLIYDKIISESFVLGIFGLSNIKHIPLELPDVYEKSDYIKVYQNELFKGQTFAYMLAIFFLWMIDGLFSSLEIPITDITNSLFWIMIAIAIIHLMPLYGTNTGNIIIAAAKNDTLGHNFVFALSSSISIVAAIGFRLFEISDLSLLSMAYLLFSTCLFCNFHFWGRKLYPSFDD